MKDHELRIKVAELIGFEQHKLNKAAKHYTEYRFWPPATERHKEAWSYGMLPDFPRDLNAMHEAEKMLTPAKGERYACLLCGVAQEQETSTYLETVHHSARERAEAFVKVMEGV